MYHFSLCFFFSPWGFLICLLLVLTAIPCSTFPWLMLVLLNTFCKCCLGSHPRPGNARSQAKQRQALGWSFRELPKKLKHTTTVFFETHIHITPSNTANLYQECMLLTSWALLLWGWATVDGQSEIPQCSY